MECIEINSEMIDDPEINKLTNEQLGKLFKEAFLYGKTNICSKYMRRKNIDKEVAVDG
jgi:hypothetical protein